MAVTQYIGSRYVPLFADPSEWSSANAYEALTIVLHEGNSFTSKQPVPVGIDISNEDYWAETGNYNAQVEQYRREARASKDAADAAQADIDTLLPKTAFSTSATVKDAIDATSDSISSIATIIPAADFDAENSVKKYIDDGMANVNGDLEAIREYYRPPATIILDSTQFSLVKNLSVPQGHVTQAACLVNSVLYVTSHIANDQPLFINKFNAANDFELIESVQTTLTIHGNSMCYDVNSNCIIICDISTRSLYYFSLPNCVYLGSYSVNDLTSPGQFFTAYCVSEDGLNAYGNMYESNSYMVYEKNPRGMVAYGITPPHMKGSSGTQDMTYFREKGFAQLFGLFPRENKGIRNFIRTFAEWGTPYLDIMLPDTKDTELEGLAYDKNARQFLIVGMNGELFNADIAWFFNGTVGRTEYKYASQIRPLWNLPQFSHISKYQPNNLIITEGTGTIQRFVEFPNVGRMITLYPIVGAFPSGVINGSATAGGAMRWSGTGWENAPNVRVAAISYDWDESTARYWLRQVRGFNIQTPSDYHGESFTMANTDAEILAKFNTFKNTYSMDFLGTSQSAMFGPQRWGHSFNFNAGFIPTEPYTFNPA